MKQGQQRTSNKFHQFRTTVILAGSFSLATALVTACGSDDSDTDDDDPTNTGGTDTGGSATGGNGAGGPTGGRGPSAGGSATGGLSTGGNAMGGLGGMGTAGMGGGDPLGAACTEDFEVGDCDAAILSYWHNPDTGQCEMRTWGGCGGNDNRYSSLEECQDACDVEPAGASCVVGGITYPHGTTGVPDPFSCNSCSCNDGEITGCTEAHCPQECPEGTDSGTDCANCGPTDECRSVRTGCFETCDSSEQCDGGLCSGGICRNLCG